MIYFHTHHFLIQHQYLSPEPPNDFAYWVTNVLQEDRLGEQLAAIDIIQFRSLRELRDRLIAVIEAFLEQSQTLRTAPPGEEFHFREAATFIVPTGYRARDLAEFADCVEQIGFGSLSFHIFDARLRLERGASDFSEWLKVMGEPVLADAVDRLDRVLDRLHVPRDKPIVTQVSRFDRLKDPVGVIEAFNLAQRYNDCRLVLAGGGAADDPEGAEVLAHVRAAAEGNPDIHILDLPPTANVEINALQRASTIVLQKSLKEGFGLTVSEALGKGKPVIAGAVGGIPLQIAHRYSGILAHTVEGTAFWIKQLLNSPDYARRLGDNGREHVRTNFLVTRHLREYLLLFLFLEHKKERVVYLE